MVGTQVTPTEWSYDLTFAPLDNYSIFQPTTTITLTGLFGVTTAAGPTSTDFPEGNLDTTNLNWTAQVLADGTEVQWTHVGPGTGNFDTDKHVFGFRVFADGAVNGLVTVASSGISRDTHDPLPDGSFNLDFTGTVAGPIAPTSVVPEPSSLISACLGLAGLAGYAG